MKNQTMSFLLPYILSSIFTLLDFCHLYPFFYINLNFTISRIIQFHMSASRYGANQNLSIPSLIGSLRESGTRIPIAKQAVEP